LERDVKDVKEVKEGKEKAVRTGPVKTYADLLVYRQAYQLALSVSQITKLLPRHEQFELGRQLRRSARSVPANVVEGWTKRNSAADFKRHLMIAAGETAETKFWIELAVDEGVLPEERARKLMQEYAKLGFMIHNLWKEWRKL
jgi:four helix bundle protein